MHYDDENDDKTELVEGRRATQAAPSTPDFPRLVSSTPASASSEASANSEASDQGAAYEDDEDNLIYVRGYN